VLPHPIAARRGGAVVKAKERVMWVLGFFALVAAIVAAISFAKMMGIRGAPDSPLVGSDAPSIALPQVPSDETVDTGELEGEVVLLDFWASWCGPCRQSIPALNQVHERYQGRIRMYGVNLDHGMDVAGVQRAHRSFGAQFPSLRDVGGAAQSAYMVQSIPTLVLIDREGVIRHVQMGVPDPDRVADRIDDLL